MKMLTDFFFCFVTMHALTDRQAGTRTDGRTDGQNIILIARPRLHSMQRGKNLAYAPGVARASVSPNNAMCDDVPSRLHDSAQ